MTKKLFSLVLLILAIASLAIWLAFRLKATLPTKVSVAGKPLEVTIARTVAEKEKGLSEKPSLCSGCGLLFLFDQPGIYPFWMRKMRFDIDILWIKDDRVVDVTYGAKKPSAEEFEVPKQIYQSQVPIDKVLEVNAGWAAGNGIKVGDEVRIKY
jgi:hypothetical protein